MALKDFFSLDQTEQEKELLGEPRPAVEPIREGETLGEFATTPRKTGEAVERLIKGIPLSATEEELSRQREVSGIPEGPERGTYAPERFMQAVEPLKPETAEDYFKDSESIYTRFFRYDDEKKESSSRGALEQAVGFYRPTPRAVYDEETKTGYKPQLLLDKKITDTYIDSDGTEKNLFMFVRFPEGLSVEEKSALMARSDAYSYAVAKPGQEGPVDFMARDENGMLANAVSVKPRYMSELRGQVTPATSDLPFSSLTGYLYPKLQVGQGKEKLSKILTDMGIVSPTIQLALLAAEDTGDIPSARGFGQGVRGFSQFIEDTYDFLTGAGKTGMTAVGTFNSPGGGFAVDVAKKQIELVGQLSQAQAIAEMDAENKGMMFTDPNTGVRYFNPDYRNDYISALEAEGFDREAAERYWKYNSTIFGDAASLVGEEAIPATVAGGFRLGFGVANAIAFNRYITKVTGFDKVEDALKNGYTPGALFSGFLESRGTGFFNRINQEVIIGSARILSTFKGGFAGLDGKARQVGVEQLKESWAAVVGKRNELATARIRKPSEVARLQRELTKAKENYDKKRVYVDTLTENLIKDSWTYQTLKNTGYGVAGAALAGSTIEEYFGSDYAPLGEILGYIGGATAFNTGAKGVAGLVKFSMMRTDDLLDLLEDNLSVVTSTTIGRFRDDKLYTDFDKLSGQQKKILTSLSGLSGAQFQGVKANAAFVDNIRTTLSTIKDANGNQLFDEQFLDTTIAIVTGLNVLRLAESQLTQKISVGEINDFGPDFYTREAFLGQNSELLQRLNIALAQILPATKDNQQLTDFATGLQAFAKDMTEQLKVRSELVVNNLKDRQNLLKTALVGDESAWLELGIRDISDLPKQLSALIRQDDELFIQAQKYLGRSTDEALEELDKRVRERDEFIRTTAEAAARTVGGGRGMYENGPDRFLLISLTSAASRNYNRGTARYADIDPEIYMDGTRVYDYLLGISDDVAEGAQREAGAAMKGASLRNYRSFFQSSAARALTRRFNLDPTQLDEISKAVGAKPGDYLDTWEKLRAVGGGDTLGMSEKKLNFLKETLTKDGDLSAFQALDLPVNIMEFKDISSGIQIQVRNLFGRQQTGQGTRDYRNLYEELHDVAQDEAFGFQRNYFDEDNIEAAVDQYDLLAQANKDFREFYAERYMRGSRFPRILRGRSPEDVADPSMPVLPGVLETQKTADVLLGELSTAQGALKADSLRETQKTLNQGFGSRVPEEGIVIKTAQGETKVRAGSYVLMESDENVDALRQALQMKLAEDVWNLPGMLHIRDLARVKRGNLPLINDKIRKALMQGDAPDATVSRDMIDSYGNLSVLRQNSDGTYTEVPLVDLDVVYHQLSLDVLLQGNEKMRGVAAGVGRELNTTLEAMIAARKARTATLTDEYRTLQKATENIAKDPASFFDQHFNRGAQGVDEIFQFREGLEAQARYDARELAREQGVDADDVEDYITDYVNNVVEEFDVLQKDHYGRWVRSQVTGITDDIRPMYDPTTGKSVPVNVQAFKSGKLLEVLGADGGANATRNREMFLEVFGGNEEKYEQLVALGQWGVLQQRKGVRGVVIDGIAQGLSVESWISRIYSINRGVVSPRYVAAEAMVKAIQMQGVSMVEMMLADKQFAKLTLKILNSDQPLTEKENKQFLQTGIVAMSMILQRYGFTEEEIQQETIKILRPEDRELYEIQTQIGGAYP